MNYRALQCTNDVGREIKIPRMSSTIENLVPQEIVSCYVVIYQKVFGCNADFLRWKSKTFRELLSEPALFEKESILDKPALQLATYRGDVMEFCIRKLFEPSIPFPTKPTKTFLKDYILFSGSFDLPMCADMNLVRFIPLYSSKSCFPFDERTLTTKIDDWFFVVDLLDRVKRLEIADQVLRTFCASIYDYESWNRNVDAQRLAYAFFLSSYVSKTYPSLHSRVLRAFAGS